MVVGFIPKNIFIVGGTGWLGAQVTQALINRKAFNIKLLVRKDAFEKKKALLDGFKAGGATLIEGDTSNVAQLAEAFKGSDTVLSVLGGDGLFSGDQNNLLEAAKAAGVTRFIPSEFGFEIEDKDDFVLGGKIKLREAIINSGLEYTFIFTSAFYEMIYGPLGGFDLANGKVRILGDGNTRFSAISTADIARFVPEILLDPSSKNQRVHLLGENITFHEAVQILEQEQLDGQKKFDITYQSLQDIDKLVSDPQTPLMAKIVSHLARVLITTNQLYSDEDSKKYSAGKFKVQSLREYARSLKH